MERTELINAMRMIKDHCESELCAECSRCEIQQECEDSFNGAVPCNWILDGEDE